MKYLKMKYVLIAIMLSALTAFDLRAQVLEAATTDSSLAAMIAKVQLKLKETSRVSANEYQSSYRRTVRTEGQTKASSEEYEEYCLNNGKIFCRQVLVRKNGQDVPEKEIRKAREKIARDISKQDVAAPKDDPFLGYGIWINHIWVDPAVFLRDCRILSSTGATFENRAARLLTAGDCTTEREPPAWQSQIGYMAKVEAKILIDVEDEGVIRMQIFPRQEFFAAASALQLVPVVTMENLRVPEGYWFSKRIRFDAGADKSLFPTLKDDWEYEFFDYRKLTVKVDNL